MAFYIGVNLDVSSYQSVPHMLNVYVIDRPGAAPKTYSVPLPHVPLQPEQADDEWIRDVLVAAIEVL